MSLIRARLVLILVLVAAVFAGGLTPPSTVTPRTVAVSTDEPPADNPEPRPLPPDTYQEWDGTTGVQASFDPRYRQLVSDIADGDDDPEVRQAASDALAGDDAIIMAFLQTGIDDARAVATARRDKEDRDNIAAIEQVRGSGGPRFNAEVERVLVGTPYDRAGFVDYGMNLFRTIDNGNTDRAKQLADRKVSLLKLLITNGGPEVRRTAQAALDAGGAAIDQYFDSGYTAAAQMDAAANEQQLKDTEARDKAADELTDLAKKAKRASQARQNLMVAHGQGLQQLEIAANAMTEAARQARQAANILRSNDATGTHPAGGFDAVKAELNRQLGVAQEAAGRLASAAAAATAQTDILAETGLTYGSDWAQMTQGMRAAGDAAVGAIETSQHATDATEATDKATDAKDKAEKHADQAAKYRANAEQHARVAAQLATAAQTQAKVAKDAAARARQDRLNAEGAEKQAWAAAGRAHDQRLIAEQEATNAENARKRAESERNNAAGLRAQADQKAALAASSRATAQQQAAIASAARQHADGQEITARTADQRATNAANAAEQHRDAALAAERAQRAADAKAQALAALAEKAKGTTAALDARNAANAAQADADTARGAATGARAAANVATGAAADARAFATAATDAAARARAAAADAQAAAARANVAASNAEAAAADAQRAATQANVLAADATYQETKAAEAARTARDLANKAQSEAVAALRSAERTRDEANDAASEAVSAADQADIAVRAAAAARQSASGVADATNTAISLVAPFVRGDVDADFVAQVAAQASTVSTGQADAAQQRANEANQAAQDAQAAADRAAAEVKPAFDAAAAAAKSASAAAASAADAQKSAAAAASDGALARAAAARANQANSQAHTDALAARDAANRANSDAAVANRAANDAEAEATAARGAADRAETDATAANAAAARAETDATAAQSAADAAKGYADHAATEAKRAGDAARDAQLAAIRAEDAARKAAEQQRKDQAGTVQDSPLDGMNEEEQFYLWAEDGDELVGQFGDAVKAASKGIIEFVKENGVDVLLEVTGINDLKRCFGQGDVESCLWTVINVASLVVIIGKLPSIGKAVYKVVKGLDAFLKSTSLAKKFVDTMRPLVKSRLAYCLEGLHAAYAMAGACLSVLRDYSPLKLQYSGFDLTVQRNSMDHILRRHHPTYFDPLEAKTQNDLMDKSMTPQEIDKAIASVLNANKNEVIRQGRVRGTVIGTYGGVRYQVGWVQGRIGQFFPAK